MVHADQALMYQLQRSELGDGGQLSALPAKDVYFGLLDARPDPVMLEQSRHYLHCQLDRVAQGRTDLPADTDGLMHWMQSNTASVGRQYRDYLAARRSGGPRRYFPATSHALHFLKAVAPTKLVDGAWLYGVVSQWRDARYAELIRIYLEELGEGDAQKNHVLLYKQLLAAHECTGWEHLDDAHFVQGAIQLSLARHAPAFLPEIIGFNLGYEQLPLHLLICAYELNELGIDPYYFTLHVTIDNAATGHAARAVKSVIDAMPQVGDQALFYRRVQHGYRLNRLGAGTTGIIAEFDLEQELLDILAAKASVGAQLHSDYCRIAGKTVNEWLAAPEPMRGFVEALEKTGWIRRHEPPANSRFWKLIVGEKAPMFGVFNAYERQVLHDWIAGDSLQTSRTAAASYRNRGLVFDGPPQGAMSDPAQEEGKASDYGKRQPRYPCRKGAALDDAFTAESTLLRDRLANAPDKDAAMDLLVPWLSPVHHHGAAGLMATRFFSQWLRA